MAQVLASIEASAAAALAAAEAEHAFLPVTDAVLAFEHELLAGWTSWAETEAVPTKANTAKDSRNFFMIRIAFSVIKK